MTKVALIKKGKAWFKEQGWKPFPFQLEAWNAYLSENNGIVNAPTGSGKTYSLIVPIILESMTEHSESVKGIQAIWITPIRALAKEISNSAQRAADGLGVDWKIGVRSGDTSTSERTKQKKNPPQILITTPESLHLLLATQGYPKYFEQLKVVVADEWHELVGSKRGVQLELALSRLRGFLPNLKTWGISATIGNMQESLNVLMGHGNDQTNSRLIKSNIEKRIIIESVIPDQVERFPWAGHLGITLLEKVIPIIQEGESTLIFTNTRAQCEIWYQRILEVSPDMAGIIAMHHGSISRELRDWVEASLHDKILKAVVCTSSLDLGVDFRPVENIVQIGSPKGVARFIQRAGRSGHRPGAVSKIHFVPTNSLELIEADALRNSFEDGNIEDRMPYIRSFDVLIQYLVTLACSEGFDEKEILKEIRQTYSYESVTDEEWAWILSFLTFGGSLEAYDEYQKIGLDKEGKFRVMNKGIAMRHRMSMGTIVGETAMKIKYVRGKSLGTVEEWFISQLKPGDVFWFAGRSLKLVRIKDAEVHVKRANSKTGKIPAWLGGRLLLSTELSTYLRKSIDRLSRSDFNSPELQALRPLIEIQQQRSHVPKFGEVLIEYFQDREGHHLVIYPFEGRFVHEGLSTILAYRISKTRPISFSIAMNDYGFELLSDDEIDIEAFIKDGLFDTQDLGMDIHRSINSVEMARRKFKDIASISGLLFKGFPGKSKKDKHLQSSSNLLFDVFQDYESDNLLYNQAFDEVRTFQLEESRLREALKRINESKLVITSPRRATPFAFPIMVDRLRERLSSERLADRVRKMKLALEKA